MRTSFFTLILLSSSLAWSGTPNLNPLFTGAEVKISYPCSVLGSLPKNKSENELITFFEMNQNVIYRAGYVIRRRESDEASDFTIKYRIQNNDPLEVDSTLFSKLQNSSQGKLKCELDITYGEDNFRRAQSCSFKSDTKSPVKEHFDFIKMMNKTISGWDQDLYKMHEIKVEATSWKFKLTDAQKDLNPFDKKPSIEQWMVRGECKLEVSGKFDMPHYNEEELNSRVDKGFSFLKSLVKSPPASSQGNKTAWVLGL